MTRPPFNARLLAHPVVFLPVMLGGAGMLYVAWIGGGMGGLVLAGITGSIMAMAVKAEENVTAYKRWKREWDALADPADQPVRHPGTKRGFALAILLLVGGLYVSVQDHATNRFLLGWAIGVGMMAMLFLALRGLVRRLGRGRQRRLADAKPAAVVAKPLMGVPSLRGAYAALPEHCRRILTKPAP